VLNPRVRHVAIDGALFNDEVERRQIMAVPMVFLNGQPFGSGRMELAEIVAKLDTGAAARDAARLNAAARFDMLVVGGGPAGVSAAMYAARKGIRTGLVTDRVGGQTLDTLGIENYLSVAYTEGPKFAAALHEQLRAHEIDLIAGQRVAALQPDGEIGLTLDNGATLKARSVVLAPGARWRNVDVPGEAEYRNKGVAYCPHCDGPLFKGKKVAVIGGGNSGVEAAIDLAGIVEHVTVIEFAEALKADAVLVDKLNSLPNVRVHLNAQTTEITGDGQKVNGLVFKDRSSGALQRIELAGVFVQIGLVPNTEWLKGTIELSRHGEIIVDARGATSLPGVFAAGDATTVPYKQIVIAAGDGSKAALSAFDHLIRSPAPH
jgi:alkyl hydroperoxide reductase subunit F